MYVSESEQPGAIGERRTTASCSFSHSKYNSAAVRGLGWRSGTPTFSLLDSVGTTLELRWLLSVVTVGGGAMICWDERRECDGANGCCADLRRSSRGEPGKVLMSGAIVVADSEADF